MCNYIYPNKVKYFIKNICIFLIIINYEVCHFNMFDNLNVNIKIA